MNRGFQTHNLTGHRGIINKLVFYPEGDTYHLISTAEDYKIKVWDLILKTEIANIAAHSSLITGIEFTEDRNFMISSSRDGSLAIFNVKEKYKLVSTFNRENSDLSEEEINTIKYYNFRVGGEYEGNRRPYVIIGGKSGSISIFDLNKKRVCF